MVVGWFSVLFTHHVSLLYVHEWSIHYGLVPSMSSGLNISCQMRLWTAVLAPWSLLFPFAIDSESWPLQMVFVRTKWATPWKRVFGEIMHFRIMTAYGSSGSGQSRGQWSRKISEDCKQSSWGSSFLKQVAWLWKRTRSLCCLSRPPWTAREQGQKWGKENFSLGHLDGIVRAGN